MKEKLFKVSCYVDQLIKNDEGDYDRLSNSWFIVPESWLEKQVKESGFESIDHFYDTYTYDDTDGWLAKAHKDLVLEGVGSGKVNIE